MKRAAINGDCVILVFTVASAEETPIFHFPYYICHSPLPATARDAQWRMTNVIWKMENESVTHSLHGRVRPGFERGVIVGQNHGLFARQFEPRREDGFDVAGSLDLL